MNIFAWVTCALTVFDEVYMYILFKKKSKTKFLVWFNAGILTALCLYISWNQYTAWKLHAPGLIPPHTPISYFISYVGFRVWAPYVISGLCALLWWLVMRLLNKKYEERFFYKDEFICASLALLLVGYPAILLYIIAFFVLYIVWSLIHLTRYGKNARASMQFFWIPLALCVILLVNLYIQNLSWWSLLRM